MLVGLNQVDGKQYYFSASGAMQTGWRWFDNHYRYFESNGAMQTGWKWLDGNWYYCQADGYKVNEEGIWKQVVTVDKKPNHSTNKQEAPTLTDKSDKINEEEKQENHKEVNSSNSEKQNEDSIIESSISNKKEKEW